MLKINIDKDFFIQVLIKDGADVYLKNDHGISPISLAHRIGNDDLKKYFIQFDYTEEC